MCNNCKKKLVGRWVDDHGSVEFTDEGNIILKLLGDVSVGKYEIISTGIINVDFVSSDQNSAVPVLRVRRDIWRYEVDSNSLVIHTSRSEGPTHEVLPFRNAALGTVKRTNRLFQPAVRRVPTLRLHSVAYRGSNGLIRYWEYQVGE